MISNDNTSRKETDSLKVISKQMQTPLQLFQDTPRKKKLKTRITSLKQEKLKKLKEQLKKAFKK